MGSTVSYSESDDLFSNEVADTPVSQNVQRDQIEFSSVNLKDDAAPIGTIKVNTILVGHESVGKTAFKIQLTSESFNSNIQPTIGFEMFSFTRVFHRTQFEYQVLDTSGSPKYAALEKSQYKDKNAVLVVYDVTNRNSFEQVKSRFKPNITKMCPTALVMLVATKIDLEEARQVRTSEGQLLADTEGMHYVEISNKTGEGIQELVREISKLIFDKEQGGALESTRKD